MKLGEELHLLIISRGMKSARTRAVVRTVLLLPPSAFMRRRVSIESRYGTTCFFLPPAPDDKSASAYNNAPLEASICGTINYSTLNSLLYRFALILCIVALVLYRDCLLVFCRKQSIILVLNQLRNRLVLK